MEIKFTTHIGDDILVNVSGEYSHSDTTSLYTGGFDISTVFLEDGCQDINSILSLPIVERLESKGIIEGKRKYKEL